MLSKQKTSLVVLLSSALLAACGGSSSSSGSSSSDEPFCSGEQMAGEWQIVANASGFTSSEIVTLTQEDAVPTNSFSDTIDGINLEGTINDDCNVIRGTFSSEGITGDFTMIKQ